MWSYYHWYNLSDHCIGPFHRSILLLIERIHPLVVRSRGRIVPRPTYCWSCILYQILHQGPRVHQNQNHFLNDPCYLLIQLARNLESLLLPMALQIWCCLCRSWCCWIHHANQESLHGMESLHCYLPWFHLGLLPMRSYHILNCSRWKAQGRRNGHGWLNEGPRNAKTLVSWSRARIVIKCSAI